MQIFLSSFTLINFVIVFPCRSVQCFSFRSRWSWWPCFPVTDRTHSLWPQLEETDHLKQKLRVQHNPVLRFKKKKKTARRPAWNFHLQIFLPTRKKERKKKPQHISLSARSVSLLNNQRLRNLLQPYVEIALCLNWIDECIVTAGFFSSVCRVFFLFITLLNYKMYV